MYGCATVKSAFELSAIALLDTRLMRTRQCVPAAAVTVHGSVPSLIVQAKSVVHVTPG